MDKQLTTQTCKVCLGEEIDLDRRGTKSTRGGVRALAIAGHGCSSTCQDVGLAKMRCGRQYLYASTLNSCIHLIQGLGPSEGLSRKLPKLRIRHEESGVTHQ